MTLPSSSCLPERRRRRFLSCGSSVIFGSIVLLHVAFCVSLRRTFHSENSRCSDLWEEKPSSSESIQSNDACTKIGTHPQMNVGIATIKPKIASMKLSPKLSPSFSSVDYFGCCGAGHRFSKLADAYYLAKRVEFSIRVFFGYCTDTDEEIFSSFFGPQPYDEAEAMAKSATPDMVLKVNNEAPGFIRLIREGPNTTCLCTDDRLESDVELFRGLRDRFRAKDRVDSFRDQFFANHTVIGMHVRAGNGETGDFERKNRTISDASKWQESIAKHLVSMSVNWANAHPPLLFIATDTAHIITSFRKLLAGRMPVVHLLQDRKDHGQGVLFGERGNVTKTGHECMGGWESVFTDMMILSHADVVVAARPSSFTQSIPMTLALSTEKAGRKVAKSYCEVNPAATQYVCYEDLKDWCCNGYTAFSLEGIQRYEYRRMPRIQGIDENDYQHRIHLRPRRPSACIPAPPDGTADCLPYQFPAPVELQSAKERARWRKDMAKNRRHARSVTN